MHRAQRGINRNQQFAADLRGYMQLRDPGNEQTQKSAWPLNDMNEHKSEEQQSVLRRDKPAFSSAVVVDSNV
jgi:hypothetical protein